MHTLNNASQSAPWLRLPAEMQLAVIAVLADDRPALSALTLTSKSLNTLATPALYNRVSIPSLPALHAFLACVPAAHGAHIRTLSLCTASPGPGADEWRTPAAASSTPRTDALVRLLARTPHLAALSLRLSGGLAPHALPAFARLPRLAHLAIANADDDAAAAPLSERLVTALALSLPALTHLALARVTRSQLHAPDLAPCALPRASPAPFAVPLVTNDGAVRRAPSPPSSTSPADDEKPEQEQEQDHDPLPPSPLLTAPPFLLPAPAPPLALPTLLTHPALTHLSILGTHLGSPLWRAAPTPTARARLTSLELGAHPNTPPDVAAAHARAVLRAAGSSALRRVVLHVGLAEEGEGEVSGEGGEVSGEEVEGEMEQGEGEGEEQGIEEVRLTPLVPPTALAPTLRVLRRAARVVLQALPEDVADVCEEMAAYLHDGGEGAVKAVCVEIVRALEGDVVVDADVGEGEVEEVEVDEDGREAVSVLRETCARAGVRWELVGLLV
ncbi:hypothetical protein DENSPDRAFT_882225 [Dentipellis sp. KUC8613]|nr:hypothetical protein DENSPDRAFT_882225 [Dentipellis sp. KUC8613]